MSPAVLAALLLFCGCAEDAGPAEPGPDLERTGRVVDAAEIFDAAFERQLTEKLARLERDTKVQLVVASTPDLKGREIAEYSYALANAWGIGSAERNDGLLLLIAPNERQVRIEVGYGLEASVRDEEAAEIIREDILPAFRKGEYEQGAARAVESLIIEVTPFEQKKAA